MNNAKADVIKTTKEIDNLGKESDDSAKQVDNLSKRWVMLMAHQKTLVMVSLC